MKKLLASILICCMVLGSYRQAQAVLPAIPVAATAAATALGLAGGIYYYMQSGGITSVNTSNILRNAAAAYFVLDTANRISKMMIKDLTASKSTQAVINTALANPNSLPILNAAASKLNYNVGSVLSSPEGNRRITSVNGPLLGFLQQGTDFYSNGSFYVILSVLQTDPVKGFYCRYMRYYTVADSDHPVTPPVPVTPEEFVPKIANSDGSPKSQAIQDELDKAMQLPGYVPTFTDATTGLPWAPPADVVSPAEAAEYEKRQAAAAAAAAATAAANQAVDAAQAAHDAAVADAAANPSDLDAQEKVRSTLVQLTNAQAAAAAAAANEAALGIENAASETQAEDFPASVPPPPELLRFNWGAATKLIGQLETTWPFNLIMSLRGLLAPLEAPPTAPSFDLHIYGDQKLTLDLSLFDSIAAISRWAISILLTSLGIMAIVRWYRG